VHNSLLADYYDRERRGRVYAVHQSAIYAGSIIGPAFAGSVFSLTGTWRAAFMVAGAAACVMALFGLRLPEPVRGATDDLDAALAASEEEPISLREAARTLLAVPTLKRQYAATVFIGAGIVPLAFLVPFYFQRVYHVHPFGVGLIQSADALFLFLGIAVSGMLTPRWFAKHPGEPLRYAGGCLAIYGVGLLGTAISPNMTIAIVVGLVASFFGGGYYPAHYSVQSIVSPARVRTLSFGYGALFLAAGVIGIWIVLVGIFEPSWNLSNRGFKDYRLALGALVPWWVIAGIILATARNLVPGDADKALRTLAAAVELRKNLEDAGGRSLLLCNAVDVAYDKVQVLFDVDFEVRQGEIVALLGTNGAGKSTLLKAITGLVPCSPDMVLLRGEPIGGERPDRIARRGIALVPEGRRLFRSLSVEENLVIGGERAKPGRWTLDAVYQLFPILGERRRRPGTALSGGQQQMVAIGRALMANPDIILFDEISLGLAPVVIKDIYAALRPIAATGVSIILVEQDVSRALGVAKTFVCLQEGKVSLAGRPAEHDRAAITAAYFGMHR